MKSRIIKRSIKIAGHKSSVSLEDEFWDGLQEIASREKMPLATLVGQIYDAHDSSNLSSSIRLFVLNDLRACLGLRQSQNGEERTNTGMVELSASLIGQFGSSAFRLSTTSVSMSLTGSCFSSELAPRPFHYGIRGRGGTI